MRSLVLTLLAVALGTASCITVETPVPSHPTPAFVTATLPSTRTPFASHTPAATASTPTTPIPTAAANCKDAAVLLQDVTIADGTKVDYGAKFTKTWQFRNSGGCPWHGYSIAFVSGDRMGAPDTAPVDDTAPKANVNISVDLVAPTSDGVYTGIFELHNAKGQPVAIGIEKSFWVKITVGTATIPTVPVASSAVPTVTGTVTTPKGPLSCKYVVSGTYPGEVISLINKARATAGLSALTVNARLTASAQGHSIDMACFSLLSHSGSDGSTIQERAAAAGYSGSGSVEEIIFASGYPQDAFNWWMGDPAHKDIILDPHVSSIGAGYAYVSDSAYGGYYTVDVGSP